MTGDNLLSALYVSISGVNPWTPPKEGPGGDYGVWDYVLPDHTRVLDTYGRAREIKKN